MPFPRRPTARVTFLSGVGARLRATESSKSQAAVHGSLSGPHIHVRAFVSAADAIQGIG
jgi:hypothetical protein